MSTNTCSVTNIYLPQHPTLFSFEDLNNSSPGIDYYRSASRKLKAGQSDEEIQVLVKKILFVHSESGLSFLEYAISHENSRFIHHVLNDERTKKYINYKNSHSIGPLTHLIKNSDKFTQSELISLIKRFVNLGANIHEQSYGSDLLQKVIYPCREGIINIHLMRPNHSLITYLSYLGASSSQTYKKGSLEPDTIIAINEGRILKITDKCLDVFKMLKPIREIVFSYFNSFFITEVEPLENDWIKI